MTRSFWPSPAQERLLTVALGDDAAAAAAWRELRPRLDLDALEAGSFALLPLAYRAVARLEPEDSLLPRLKGIVRSTWAKNNLLLERTRESFDALAATGVDALLVGGLGCAIRFYGDLGLRPTATLEVLVPPAARGTAVAALGRAGWIPKPNGTPLWLRDEQGRWCVLKTGIAADFGDEPALFATSDSVDLRGTRARAATPGDELLVGCVTGARAAPAPTIAWIADAALLIRSAGDRIDWSRLVDLGAAHDQTLRLRDALGYVARLPGVRVPDDVLERLRARRVAPRERVAHAIAARAVRGEHVRARLLGRSGMA